MISAILLSAGQSSRFGSPKALADWHDQPVIEAILKTLELSEVSEIIVVLGAHRAEIQPVLLKHTSLKVVYNKDHKFGQTSSFQAGLREASGSAQGFMLWPVDYPAITAATIQTLCTQYEKDHHRIVIPTFNNKKGHPPILPKLLKEIILDVPVELGINTVLQQHADLVDMCAVDDPGVRATFNTREELAQIKLL